MYRYPIEYIMDKLQLLTIGILTFSVMLSISIVGPLLSLLVSEESIYLGVNPNFSIGLIFALGGLSLSIFQIPFSNLSYRYGNRKLIIIGDIFVAVSVLLIGYSGYLSRTLVGDPILIGWSLSAWLLALLRILQGVGGAATWPILMATIPSVINEEEIGLAMGIFGASFGLGMALGPVLGPTIAALTNIYAPFIIAASIAFISIFLAIKIPNNKVRNIERNIFEIPNRIDIILLSIAGFTLMYSMGTLVVIYPRYLLNILGFNVKELALLMALASLSFAFLQPIFGKISIRIGFKRQVIIGLLITMFSVTIISVTKDLLSISLAMFLFGFSGAIMFPAASSLLTKLSDASELNKNTGFFNMMISLGVTLSPILVGLISDTFSYKIAFITLPIVVLIGLISILKV